MKSLHRFHATRIVTVVLLLTMCIMLLSGCSLNTPNNEDVSKYFVKYDDATVLIKIIPNAAVYSHCTAGFVSQKSLDDFESGTIGAFKVYNPYVDGEYLIVNINSIKTIIIYSYKDFYEKFNPNKMTFE